MGDAAYSLIIEKNPKKARDKVMNAVGAVAKVGGKILDWMKGVVGRFWEALPKLKLPEKIGPFSLPFGLGGMEILDPKMFMGPYGLLGAFGTMGKAMVTAIFQPDKEFLFLNRSVITKSFLLNNLTILLIYLGS